MEVLKTMVAMIVSVVLKGSEDDVDGTEGGVSCRGCGWWLRGC